MKKTKNHVHYLFLGYTILTSLSSCMTGKQLTYFNTIPRDTITNIQPQTFEATINKNDILQININAGLDEETNRIFFAGAAQAASTSGTVATATASPTGYLVDESGIVKLPLIGAINVLGQTKAQLALTIEKGLVEKKFAKEAIVTVRIINYRVTVLGEVSHPGVIPVPNEKITLPEALGQAGDLTVYGKREKLVLIREIDGKRVFKHFSLNTGQIFDKDLYNLRNQDIIYVEANNAKAATADRTTQLLPIAISSLSLLVLIYAQLIKK